MAKFEKGQGGRRKGAKNKATALLKAAFQKHGDALVKALLKLTKSKDEHVRLKAIMACLDRGWGKPPQPVTGDDGEGPVIARIERVFIDPKDPEGKFHGEF